MTEILDTLGQIISIAATALVFGAMIGIFTANEIDLWHDRQARRRERARYPIGDRFRQPPGGWNRPRRPPHA